MRARAPSLVRQRNQVGQLRAIWFVGLVFVALLHERGARAYI
jgi:hypothetical protein